MPGRLSLQNSPARALFTPEQWARIEQNPGARVDDLTWQTFNGEQKTAVLNLRKALTDGFGGEGRRDGGARLGDAGDGQHWVGRGDPLTRAPRGTRDIEQVIEQAKAAPGHAQAHDSTLPGVQAGSGGALQVTRTSSAPPRSTSRHDHARQDGREGAPLADTPTAVAAGTTSTNAGFARSASSRSSRQFHHHNVFALNLPRSANSIALSPLRFHRLTRFAQIARVSRAIVPR